MFSGEATCSVPCVQSDFVCVLEQWKRLFFIEHPLLPVTAAVRHGSEDDLGDLETGLSESVAGIRCP